MTEETLSKDQRDVEIARLRTALSKQNDEICQTLGLALGYPKFCDDQANFPGTTEANGVCVGDHVAESIAAEAAGIISKLRAAEAAALRRGAWAAFNEVLAWINTQTEQRVDKKHLYRAVMEMRPTNCAITALDAARGDGWQLVPKEPTLKMERAALNHPDDPEARSMYQSIYRAMIAAAPLPGDRK